jgi:hypothetical protein
MRPAVLDVVMDRVIVAGQHLKRRKMRVGHGAARIAENLANFQIIECALFGDMKRPWIEAHAATLAIAVVDGILACVSRLRE